MIQQALSTAFILGFLLSIALGAYALFLDPGTSLNRFFCLMCISLGVWSLSFGGAIAAPDLETCISWRRFAAYGWGSMFAFILAHAIEATEPELFRRRKWLLPLLMLPACVTMYVFGLSPAAGGTYGMTRTAWGWVNVSANGFWDWFFNAYYASYMIAAVSLLARSEARDRRSRRESPLRGVATAFLLTAAAGTVTEFVWNAVSDSPIPQIAPLLMSWPMLVVYRSIRRYGFMRAETPQDEAILTEYAKTRVYRYIGGAFLAGGLLHLLVMGPYSGLANLPAVVGFTVAILLIGSAVLVLGTLRIPDGLRDALTAALLVASVPLIVLRFIEYAGATIWAFPLVVVVAALLFNNRFLLFLLSISMILTELFLSVHASERILRIDIADHAARLGILAIAIPMAYYVNGVYVRRLRDLASSSRSQRIISDISADLLRLDPEAPDREVRRVLDRLGRHLEADRIAAVFPARKGEQETDLIFAWRRDGGTAEESGNAVRMPAADGPFWNDAPGRIPQSDDGLWMVPMLYAGEPAGVLRIGMAEGRGPSLEDRGMLHVAGRLLCDAAFRIRTGASIRRIAFHDRLTGLPNRALFEHLAERAIERSEQDHARVGVLFLDIDLFSAVVDAVSPENAEQLLAQVGERLVESASARTTVSRFGGDKFVMLVEGIELEDELQRASDRTMAPFRRPFRINGMEVLLHASCGAALHPRDGRTADELVRNANIALRKAKDAGGGRVAPCTDAMKAEVARSVLLARQLRGAMDRFELSLHYQPQFDLSEGRVVSAEALLRWTHPTLGSVPPGEFVPIAEQAGLIVPIGTWVLNEACRQNSAWRDRGLPPIRMAVNISVHQLFQSDFAALVTGTLARHGLPAEALELEITESIAVHREGAIAEKLEALRKSGISVAIDDFGMGYSSLNRIHSCPVDRLKIDRQFIAAIDGRVGKDSFAELIVRMSKSLRLRSMAEGIETREQLAFLQACGCDEGQGYLFGKPFPPEEFALHFLKRSNP